jgi:hypothetical protein
MQWSKDQLIPGPEENQVVSFLIHFKGCVTYNYGHLRVNSIMDSDRLSLVLPFAKSLGLASMLGITGTVFSVLAKQDTLLFFQVSSCLSLSSPRFPIRSFKILRKVRRFWTWASSMRLSR